MKKIILLLIVSMISSCGSNEKSIDNSLDLNGIWRSNCFLVDGSSAYIEIVFLDNTFDRTYFSFDNSNCFGEISDPANQTFNTFGTFRVGNRILTDSGLMAFEMTYEISNLIQSDSSYLDIIRLEGDIFNEGVNNSNSSFPTALDFDLTFARN